MTTPDARNPDHLPFDELHADLGDHPEGRTALEGLRTALASESTVRGDVEEHARVLQSIPVIRARIANWFDSPATQGWLEKLSDIGL